MEKVGFKIEEKRKAISSLSLHPSSDPPSFPSLSQYLQGQGSTPDIDIQELSGKWQTHLRSALLQRYGVTAQELVDVRRERGKDEREERRREGGRERGWVRKESSKYT
jgi:hypothetical protein